MKISNYLNKIQLKNEEDRLVNLEKIGIDIMIKNCQEKIKFLKENENNVFDFGGDKEILNWTFVSKEVKTGRGGKKYGQYTCKEGVFNYFPNAAYGIFIKIAEKYSKTKEELDREQWTEELNEDEQMTERMYISLLKYNDPNKSYIRKYVKHAILNEAEETDFDVKVKKLVDWFMKHEN